MAAISGSLRRDSYNSALLKAAQEMAPSAMAIEFVGIDALPHFCADVESQGFPSAVRDFRAALESCDAILIATPEYNYSIPGPLKNAIDWGSREPRQPLAKKPVAIMSASPGRFGAVRAQHHLRQILVCVDAMALTKPEVMVPLIDTKIGLDGRLEDAATLELISQQLVAFELFIRRFAP